MRSASTCERVAHPSPTPLTGSHGSLAHYDGVGVFGYGSEDDWVSSLMIPLPASSPRMRLRMEIWSREIFGAWNTCGTDRLCVMGDICGPKVIG